MGKFYPYISKFRHPGYLVGFIILVGFLASQFSALGMDGITYAVLGACAVLVGVPLALSKIKEGWQAMIEGRPSKMDFAMSPSGYRRARQYESQEEAVAQSVVSPTPNRPLVVDANPADRRAVAQASPHAVTKYSNQQYHEPILHLSADCMPHIGMVLGRGVIFLGMRGSGKTSALARLLEQIFRFPIPGLVFDHEEGFLSLHKRFGERCIIAGAKEWEGRFRYQKYWGISASNAFNVGYAILESGAQVILQTATYSSLDEAADIMVKLIRGMFKWAEEQETKVPALICLDEAQYFMPQNNSLSPISQKLANALVLAFSDVNSRGRKRGLTPIIATQRPAQIQKPVITGSEIYFLMKQTYPIDLEFYEDVVGKETLKKAGITRQHIAAFDKGDALVYEGGEASFIHFEPRETEHSGITPGLDAALARYQRSSRLPASWSIDYLDDEEEDECRNGNDEHLQTSTVLENGYRNGDGNAVTAGPEIAPEEAVSPQNEASLPPGWDTDKIAHLIGAYLASKHLDNSLQALDISTSQRNRDFAREVLRQRGLWK